MYRPVVSKCICRHPSTLCSVPLSTPAAPSSPHLSYCTEGRSYPFFLIHLCSAFTALNSHGDLSDHPGLRCTVDYWPVNKPTNWESLYRFEWLYGGCFTGFIVMFLVTTLLFHFHRSIFCAAHKCTKYVTFQKSINRLYGQPFTQGSRPLEFQVVSPAFSQGL